MQIVLHFSLKYFDCKVYVLAVELTHECRFYFFYHWYSMFYVKHYHLLVYFNEQQIYLATLWSALMFQCINSLNVAQFVVKMRSNKNHKIKNFRKTFCGWGVFPSAFGCLKVLLIIYTAFTFLLNLKNFWTIYNLPWLWAPYIPALCIVCGIAQYLLRNNLLSFDCQLLIFVMEHVAGQDTFFSITFVPMGSFFEVPDRVS